MHADLLRLGICSCPSLAWPSVHPVSTPLPPCLGLPLCPLPPCLLPPCPLPPAPASLPPAPCLQVPARACARRARASCARGARARGHAATCLPPAPKTSHLPPACILTCLLFLPPPPASCLLSTCLPFLPHELPLPSPPPASLPASCCFLPCALLLASCLRPRIMCESMEHPFCFLPRLHADLLRLGFVSGMA